MNNTVNKLMLDRRSCKKLHKKVRFGSPVFITSGINKDSLMFNEIILMPSDIGFSHRFLKA